MIIRANICLSDIKKERIFTSEKSGKKYLSITLMSNRSGEPDDYGNDGNVSHSISKEERESGKQLDFCGSWRWVFKPEGMQQQRAPAPKVTAASQGVPLKAAEDDDELPF